jgi:hypothetical protein
VLIFVWKIYISSIIFFNILRVNTSVFPLKTSNSPITMCVLTYIPTSRNSYFLTNNRDEATVRTKALPPKRYRLNNTQVFFPKDPQSGGTWIATSDNFTICLLNGAFEKHTPQPPYRQSRGQIIVDFFQYKNIVDFTESYNFSGIENFTLVIIENTNSMNICELRWNGANLSEKNIDANQSHIWSSSTLYPPEVVSNREQWFEDFLKKNPTLTQEEILDFHKNGGNGDPENDLNMNRNDELKTQCIMQIVRHNQHHSFSFHDLLSNQELRYQVL